MTKAGYMVALAQTFEDNGDYERAAQILQSAIKLKEKEYGIEHPELGEDLFNLGLLCWAIDKQGEAQRLLSRSLDIYKRTFGSDHREVREIDNVIAELNAEIAQPVGRSDLVLQAS